MPSHEKQRLPQVVFIRGGWLLAVTLTLVVVAAATRDDADVREQVPTPAVAATLGAESAPLWNADSVDAAAREFAAKNGIGLVQEEDLAKLLRL